jgi:hypothetical protein
VAALGETCGAQELTATATVRLRLHLASEPDPRKDDR